MIDFNDYDILKNNISTLKLTSIDDHDQNNIMYMTDSEHEAVNFDHVKGEYVEGLSLFEVPKSNDALFINKNNELVLLSLRMVLWIIAKNMKSERKYMIVSLF